MLQHTQGQLLSIEIELERTMAAQTHLVQLGLADNVQFLTQDALVFLQTNQQRFDFILLDAQRSDYVNYRSFLNALLMLYKGELLVVDNVLSHANRAEWSGTVWPEGSEKILFMENLLKPNQRITMIMGILK